MHPGVQGSGTSDQHATTKVGGQRWTKPLMIGDIGGKPSLERL